VLTEFAWHPARGESFAHMDKSACYTGVFCRVQGAAVPILEEGMHIRGRSLRNLSIVWFARRKYFLTYRHSNASRSSWATI